MGKFIGAVMVAALLSGCGARSYGVVPLGPDSFSVSAIGIDVTGAQARTKALREAGAYCSGTGKRLLVKNITTTPGSATDVSGADIIFQCLSSNDPGLQRPSYESAPAVIIQDQRR